MAQTVKKKLVRTNYFRKMFCVLFSAVNILVISLIVLFKHFSIDYYSVVDTIWHLFPEVVIIGMFGWIIGLILDNPRNEISVNYKDLVYEELLKSKAKMSQEELEEKLRLPVEDELEEDENFAFEDADYNIGESKIEI